MLIFFFFFKLKINNLNIWNSIRIVTFWGGRNEKLEEKKAQTVIIDGDTGKLTNKALVHFSTPVVYKLLIIKRGLIFHSKVFVVTSGLTLSPYSIFSNMWRLLWTIACSSSWFFSAHLLIWARWDRTLGSNSWWFCGRLSNWSSARLTRSWTWTLAKLDQTQLQ